MSSTLSRRYAKALLDIGIEEASEGKYGTELRDIYAVSLSNPEFTLALSNSMFKLDERKALADAVLEKLGACDMVRRFFNVLIDNGKVGQIEDICQAYFALEDEISGRLRVIVASPSAPTEDLLASIKDKLKAETGKEVIITHEQDPKLLGGFIIKVGNILLDASLKVQLEHMKEKIGEGVV